MATSASLCEGPIFYFLVFTFMQRVKVFLSIPFIFLFLQASCGEEISRHIRPVEYEVSMLGGEAISPYLSMCPVEAFCSCVHGEC